MPPDCEKICELMPITLPFMSNIGPPELPWLIDASVWMKRSLAPCPVTRWTAEMIPAVTVPPSPKGLPIAITQSPTRACAESPQRTNGSGPGALILSNARSDAVSRPISLATYSLRSGSVTRIEVTTAPRIPAATT